MKHGGMDQLTLWHYWSLLLQLDVPLVSGSHLMEMLKSETSLNQSPSDVMIEDPAPPKMGIPLIL